VTRCTIDYASVNVLLKNGLEIVIEEVFRLLSAQTGDTGETLDPDGDAVRLAPGPARAEGPRHRRRCLQGRPAHFEDGSRILVPAGGQYEPWHITCSAGINGRKIVSLPGGGLAVWLDQ
jgi:hypothetical protein